MKRAYLVQCGYKVACVHRASYDLLELGLSVYVLHHGAPAGSLAPRYLYYGAENSDVYTLDEVYTYDDWLESYTPVYPYYSVTTGWPVLLVDGEDVFVGHPDIVFMDGDAYHMVGDSQVSYLGSACRWDAITEESQQKILSEYAREDFLDLADIEWTDQGRVDWNGSNWVLVDPSRDSFDVVLSSPPLGHRIGVAVGDLVAWERTLEDSYQKILTWGGVSYADTGWNSTYLGTFVPCEDGEGGYEVYRGDRFLGVYQLHQVLGVLLRACE